ncbi:sulfurtransferase [Niveibacterium terrae]|uniref:sulfurtransferase n=1 Tax=Niveibacterium terrae TaxID=3373598 RepID=UPI003A8D4DDD
MNSPLISAEALAEPNPRRIIFDVRHDLADPGYGRRAYAAGHVPGAFFLDVENELSGARTGSNGRHPLPDPEVFAALLRRYGVGKDSEIVAYDDAGGMYAARLWWLLRWIGHDIVVVLDGGFSAWLADDFPLEKAEPPRPAAGSIAVDRLTETVSAAELLAEIEAPRWLIVDARSPERFRGENETIDPVGGHIPGARNRFFRDNLSPDGRFKPPALLAAEWRALTEPRMISEVVCQCGSGITACVNLLALEIAGLPGARLYPGSWSEWCSDPKRPVEV